MKYSDYLKTDHWVETRLRKMAEAKYKCQLCEAEGALVIHHLRYKDKRGSILYREDLKEDLMCLCPTCHTAVHCFLEDLKKAIPEEALYSVQGQSTEESVWILNFYIAMIGREYWPEDILFNEDKDYQHIPEIIENIACKWLTTIQ